MSRSQKNGFDRLIVQEAVAASFQLLQLLCFISTQLKALGLRKVIKKRSLRLKENDGELEP